MTDDVVLGVRELDVMGVLWEAGSGTVAEVRDRLPTTLAYTTVLTILRNLEAKGLVWHEGEGKAHRYFPAVERREARRSAIGRLLDRLFHGSPEALVAQLVSDRTIDPETLERLSREFRDEEKSGAAAARTDAPARRRAGRGGTKRGRDA